MFPAVALIALVALAAPQAGAPAMPADIIVTSSQWGRITGKTVITDRGSFTVDPDVRIRPSRPGMPPPTIILQRETYILVKNSGTRTVKAIKWAYVFYSDAKHEHEVARVEFRSKETLKPGETKFVAESVHDPAPTSFGVAKVTDVEYQDGK